MTQSKQEVETLCLTETTHTPKCLDQFLMVLLTIYATGLFVMRQFKQGVAIPYFDQNEPHSEGYVTEMNF